MPSKLIQGDKLPRMTLSLLDGESLTLPDELPGRYLVLLFYRGHWCLYCRRQLASYQAKAEELDKLGARVVAMTVDDAEVTKAMVEEMGLTFPVAFGVTQEQVAELDP